MNKRALSATLCVIVLALAACQDTVTPALEQPAEESAQLGAATDTQDQFVVVVNTEIEGVCNCGIVPNTMTKEVELSHSASHAVSWQAGEEFGVGATVNIVPEVLAVDIGGALATTYGQDWESSISRSVGFPLTAEPGTNIEYTIEWREVWQPGSILVTTPYREVTIVYTYLRRIEGDIIGSRDLGCAQGCDSTTIANQLPDGYTLYDDFRTADSLNTNWRSNDPDQICEFQVGGSALVFNCANSGSADTMAVLHPGQVEFWQSSGVAASLRLEQTGGPFDLVTNWVCQDSGEERAYHLAMDVDLVYANEFYPLDNWRLENRGELPITPGEAHTLQIEQVTNGVSFLVDGQPMTLHTPVDWLDCLTLRDWGIDYYVWPENSIRGQIEWVSFRE